MCKSVFLFPFLFIAVACGSKQSSTPISAWGINHIVDHKAALCPAWTDAYDSTKTGTRKWMQASVAQNGANILIDQTQTAYAQYIVDGLPKPLSGVPGVTYTGYCTNTVTDSNNAVSTGYVIEFYQNQKVVYFIEYVVNTVTKKNFDYFVKEPTATSPAEPGTTTASDTFAPGS